MPSRRRDTNRCQACLGTSASVASGTGCSFSYGVNASAVPGTYTITASAALTFDIAAPLAAPRSPASLRLRGPKITDVVLPVTGSAVAGDTWTIVKKPRPPGFRSMASTRPISCRTRFSWPALPDHSPRPRCLSGGCSVAQLGINQSFVREACNGQIPTVGLNAVNIGNCGAGLVRAECRLRRSMAWGTARPGSARRPIGGHVLTASGIYSVAMGDAGNGQRLGLACLGAPARLIADGIPQIAGAAGPWRLLEMRRHVSSFCAAQVPQGRRSGDSRRRGAGSANCINIPNNSAYSLQVTITAFDHTTARKAPLGQPGRPAHAGSQCRSDCGGDEHDTDTTDQRHWPDGNRGDR